MTYEGYTSTGQAHAPAFSSGRPSVSEEAYEPYGYGMKAAAPISAHDSDSWTIVDDPLFKLAVLEKIHENRIAHLEKLIFNLKMKGPQALPKGMYAIRLESLKRLLRMAKQGKGPYAQSPKDVVKSKLEQLSMEAYPKVYAGDDDDVLQALEDEERTARLDVLEKRLSEEPDVFGARSRKKKSASLKKRTRSRSNHTKLK